MTKIGLFAGAGGLPVEFARTVKEKGDMLVVFALQDVSDRRLETIADRIYWLKFTQYRKFFYLLVFNGIRQLVMLGKIEKKVIYKDGKPRDQLSKKFKKLKDGKDYSMLGEVTRRLGLIGVKVVDGMGYLKHLIPGPGLLTSVTPDPLISADIEFGFNAAKSMAELDIGQTVVVKDRTVVAVEAMEGTDEVIERAASLAGEGCVMVKVSRPGQDMRWDVPVVGPETVKKLVQGGFSALAIESGKMFVLCRDEIVEAADSSGLIIQALV